jgi:hypothetical protein
MSVRCALITTGRRPGLVGGCIGAVAIFRNPAGWWGAVMCASVWELQMPPETWSGMSRRWYRRRSRRCARGWPPACSGSERVPPSCPRNGCLACRPPSRESKDGIDTSTANRCFRSSLFASMAEPQHVVMNLVQVHHVVNVL